MKLCLDCHKPIDQRITKRVVRCTICQYVHTLKLVDEANILKRGTQKRFGTAFITCEICGEKRLVSKLQTKRVRLCLYHQALRNKERQQEHMRRTVGQVWRPKKRKCLVCGKTIKISARGNGPSRFFCDDNCWHKAKRRGIVAPRFDNEVALRARGDDSNVVYKHELQPMPTDKFLRTMNDWTAKRKELVA